MPSATPRATTPTPTGHLGTPTGTNTCSGCHTNDSLDLRVVHRSAITSGSPTDTGCGIDGCHKTVDSRPADKTCGTGGACHADKIDGNHGAATAHTFSAASDYNNTTVAGCTNSGSGCHGADATYGNFADYHPATGCISGACHTSPSKATYTGDRECVSCHDGNFTGAPDVVSIAAATPNGHYNETTHTAVRSVRNRSRVPRPARSRRRVLIATTRRAAAGMGALYNQHQGLPAPYGATTCADCHNNSLAVTTVVTTEWATRQCDACHNVSTMPSAAQHGTTAPIVNWLVVGRLC